MVMKASSFSDTREGDNWMDSFAGRLSWYIGFILLTLVTVGLFLGYYFLTSIERQNQLLRDIRYDLETIAHNTAPDEGEPQSSKPIGTSINVFNPPRSD